MNKQKLLQKIIESDKNIRFEDFISIIIAFGFEKERSKGSHNIFKHPLINDMINVQNNNGKAKPYQIKQFLSLVEKNNLRMED